MLDLVPGIAMLNEIWNKTFALGFLAGWLLVLVANIYSYNEMAETECFDCVVGFGWPFRFYETGGFVTITRILWYGLVTDVLLATGLSVAMGLLSRRLFQLRKSLARTN